MDGRSKLDQIRDRAQRDADRDRKTLAILNLNTFNPLYVIRAWDDRYVGTPQLVEKIHPAA